MMLWETGLDGKRAQGKGPAALVTCLVHRTAKDDGKLRKCVSRRYMIMDLSEQPSKESWCNAMY